MMTHYTAQLEDRILVHTPQHVVKEPPSIEQVLFEEGLALMDGMLKKEPEDRT